MRKIPLIHFSVYLAMLVGGLKGLICLCIHLFQTILRPRRYAAKHGSTITIKLSCVITYVCQNLAYITYVGKYQKAYIKASYLLPSDFSNNFSQARCCLNRMEALLIRKKLILKFHSKKKKSMP